MTVALTTLKATIAAVADPVRHAAAVATWQSARAAWIASPTADNHRAIKAANEALKALVDARRTRAAAAKAAVNRAIADTVAEGLTAVRARAAVEVSLAEDRTEVDPTAWQRKPDEPSPR